MYKVFFNDRVVYLSERAPEGRSGTAQTIMEFKDQPELGELLDKFANNDQLLELHIFHKDMAELTAAFTSCFKCINAGGGVVLNEKGEFLVIQRNGVWDLPKGKMEKGEDFETTALREVEEETVVLLLLKPDGHLRGHVDGLALGLCLVLSWASVDTHATAGAVLGRGLNRGYHARVLLAACFA